MRERLRDWYRDGSPHKRGVKRGDKRQQSGRDQLLSCPAALGRRDLWPPDRRHLALAMDASDARASASPVLTISVMYRGRAIPIAWAHAAEATRAGAWRPHWEAAFHPDRGWRASRLDRDRGWPTVGCMPLVLSAHHPVPGLASIPADQSRWPVSPRGAADVSALYARSSRASRSALGRRGDLLFHRDAPIATAPLLARWDAGHTDPWLIVTDLPPESAGCGLVWVAEPWIECGFKDAKRGGWHWEQTKMRDPGGPSGSGWRWPWRRCGWSVSAAGRGERTSEYAGRVAAAACRPPSGDAASRPRLLSCFRRGVIVIVTSLIGEGGLPQSCFVPEPWPKKLDIHMCIPIQPGAHQKAA